MIDVYATGLSIDIGRQGENIARNIYFDLSDLIDNYGEGTATLVHMRPSDTAPYICEVERTGNFLIWAPTSTDTSYAGAGKCELRWVVGETLAKSIVYRTFVAESITGDSTVPSKYESWYEALLEHISKYEIASDQIEANTRNIATNTNDIAVLDGRVDEITTLPEGSTTGDAELADIRVGADGTVYENAGAAVRGQVSGLKSALGNINGSQVKTKQVDYSNFTISENKKITGYDLSTYVPLLVNESGSFVADIAISNLAQYPTIKFPRCSKSSQWFIIYSDSQAWNFVKTSHSKTNNYDLSNDDYGIINCKWLASTSYTRIAIVSDNGVDVTVDSQFDTFFDLMDSVKKNDSASVDIRKLYYVGTIDITKQTTSTYVPFVINSGEILTFKNNTSGNVSLYAIDASNNRVLITNGVTAGQSVTFTAEQDFVQILYWAQQLGSVSVAATDAVIYQLENAIKNSDIASVNMFGSIAAIGDSYTAGSTRNSAGTWKDYRNLSWIATLGKRTGTEWKNYGHGGATTKSFLETTEFANSLSDTACDLYFFALGQNDGNQALTIGTVADIHDADYTQNPETFYGCYGKIIQQIKNHAPNAKLVMITNWVMGSTWTDYDVAIRAIANHYSIPVIEPFDDYFFNSALYQDYKEDGHPTAMGYSSMGLAMERLFSKCVANNPSYFKFATIG